MQLLPTGHMLCTCSLKLTLKNQKIVQGLPLSKKKKSLCNESKNVRILRKLISTDAPQEPVVSLLSAKKSSHLVIAARVRERDQ